MGAVREYMHDVASAISQKQFAKAMELIDGWSTADTEQRGALALTALETLAYVEGNVTPEIIPCPRHAGAYDCTPFCGVCHGTQETAVTR